MSESSFPSEFESILEAKQYSHERILELNNFAKSIACGLETVTRIYKTDHGEHQNYYYALFYNSQELNEDTEIVLTNNVMGIGQPPIRRTLKWLENNHHTVFKLSDLIKEIKG